MDIKVTLTTAPKAKPADESKPTEENKTRLENIRELGEGWVAEETLAIAIYCSLKYQNDFSKGSKIPEPSPSAVFVHGIQNL